MGESAVGSSIEGIPQDAVLLVSGPPMTGKYELLLGLLAHNADSVIVVSTRNQASRVIDDYRAVAGDIADDRIGVVDCASHNETVEDVRDTERIKYATSPENLTQIGVKFTQLFDTFYERHGDEDRIGVGVHSLSQLLVHTNTENVYQFLQVLTGQLRSAGWLGAAVLDESAAGEETTRTLLHNFDGVVETRENDAGRRQFRIRGIDHRASDWTAF